MWLSRTFSKNTHTDAAETGIISIGGNSVLKTVSTMQNEAVQNYAPYGYSAFAPDGEEILLINGSGGAASCGTKMKDEGLMEGEVSLKSGGGAEIRLKNNGDVEINGIIITKKGVIKNSDGEVIL